MPTEPREAVIFETADVTEFELARNLIQEEGIPCRVTSSGASALLGAVLGQGFSGFHQLLVPLDCEERAEKVLTDAWKGRPEALD
jgi:hypothetical protein